MVMSKVQREATTRAKRYVKEIGKRKMSQEEIDREMVELIVNLSYIRQLAIEEGKLETRMECKEEIQVAYDAIICKEVEEELEA
jgi:hypothetical protein